jgi:hypothetical protein
MLKTPPDEEDEGDQREVLLKRQSEIDSFLEKYESTRQGLEAEQIHCREMVVALLENMSSEAEGALISAGQGNDDLKMFRDRSRATNQSTVEGLKAELKQRQKELELVKSSEPKILAETETLRENIEFMQREIESFRDVNSLPEAFAVLKNELQEKRTSYIRRRDMMKQEANIVAEENESVRKSLSVNDVHKDLEETEKKLRHFER